MGIKSAKHAVYDLKYHLVRVPKYRKDIFDDEMRASVKEIFEKIFEEYEFEIDIMEVMEIMSNVFVELLRAILHRE